MAAIEEVTQDPASQLADEMAALDRVRLPVDSLAAAIPHLRRPFTPEAIRFKVQSVIKGKDKTPIGCLIVAYIDQRLVTERLNRVIPAKWSAKFRPVDGTKLMWCELTVDGVSRVDIGESSKGLSKDLVSDSIKRAAVPFGIGVSCYALPEIKLWVRDARERIEVRGYDEKQTIVLTEYGHQTLRAGYQKWLEEFGVKRFGPPLDHGDVVGATIEEDEPEIGAGEGSGEAPPWEGVSEEHVAAIEDLMARAEAAGFPALADVGTVRMRLNHQSPEAVAEWIAAADEQVSTVEFHKAEAEEINAEAKTDG
jgi:hypothetical protein